MTTAYVDLCKALAAPFHPSEIRALTKGGKQMPYVTARVVMNRLDEVVGMECWWDSYKVGENSVECQLSILMPDGRVVTKADAGAFAGMSDQGDDDKSGYSDAFKRAAVKFGIGRFLYNDGVPIYPGDHQNGEVPNEPSLAQPQKPKASKNNRHPNDGASESGRFASDPQIKSYLAKLKARLYGTEKEPGGINGQWADHWQDPRTGEWPDVKACKNDLITIYGADGHLVKWLVETGQIDQDALETVGKPNYLGKFAAIVMHRKASDAKAMADELDGYFERTWNAKRNAIYRTHPALAPEGMLDPAESQPDRLPGKGDSYTEGE
jgi:Rad52/22 family double-strand break repair protein